MDRIVLGQHANTSIGAGLYVSIPGKDVMHPEHAQFGNLMFDSNEPHSTLNIIQTGTFKITCKRKAFSPRGDTIGTRPGDDFQIQHIKEWTSGDFNDSFQDQGFGHTFNFDTGRPASLSVQANALFGGGIFGEIDDGAGGTSITGGTSTVGSGEFLSRAAYSMGSKIGTKQGNYLDTGSYNIKINNPLPNGEIPEVALRFAIGNSSTDPPRFHPWYSDTTTTGDGGSWSDIDHAASDPTKIVHMDSNWMRLKWGGLGAEEYRGTQEEYSWESLMDFFGGDAQKIADKFGFATKEIAEEKISTHSKLLSLALTNAQGVVGLIPYANSTHIHVDAYMTPTHAGLRQPIDRTFSQSSGFQKGIGYNAIDDFAHINFPIETHNHTRAFWKYNDSAFHTQSDNMFWPVGMYTANTDGFRGDFYDDWYSIVKIL